MKAKEAANITRPLSHEDEMEIRGMTEEARLPVVDYVFIIEAISNAMPEEADTILAAYNIVNGNDYNWIWSLGEAVRIQIEKYRQEILDIDTAADQPLKRNSDRVK